MQFVTLTRPDGSLIYFGAGMAIRPSPTIAALSAQTEITYYGMTYFAREPPEEVAAAFEKAFA